MYSSKIKAQGPFQSHVITARRLFIKHKNTKKNMSEQQELHELVYKCVYMS